MGEAIRMFKFVLKRTLQIIPVLFIVSIIVFTMVRISPSDPVASMTKGKQVSAQAVEAIKARYHLDETPVKQYFIWIGGALRGDLGESFQHKQSVNFLIGERIGVTLQLVIMSAILSTVIAVPIGVLSAVKMNTPVDQALSVVTLIFVASPVFLTAIVLLLLFALRFPIFPSFGTGNGFWNNLWHLTLPAIALALNMVALTSRITRTSMIEQLGSDFVRTAVAKGMPRRVVVYKHALKNALIPVITVTSIQIGSMMVGAVLVENVFALGGIGGILIDSIKAADYPMVQGVTLLLVTIFLLINLVVDVFYAVIDPRIRLK